MGAEYAYRHIWAFMIGAILFGSPVRAAGQMSEELFSSSVDYCRRYPAVQLPQRRSSIHLSETQTVLCFDGGLLHQDITPIKRLKDGGLFVIRSWGGIVSPALEIANIIENKMAKVIIYDYCLSACAGFIYIAADVTYVVKNSVVAWHDPVGYPPPCEGTPATPLAQNIESPPKLTREQMESWQNSPKEKKDRSCNWWRLQAAFFERRGAAPDYLYRTRSQHVEKFIKLETSATGYYKAPYWMWHPRYYENRFRTKITYESYPEGQDEVDEITRRFGLPRIIYDP